MPDPSRWRVRRASCRLPRQWRRGSFPGRHEIVRTPTSLASPAAAICIAAQGSGTRRGPAPGSPGGQRNGQSRVGPRQRCCHATACAAPTPWPTPLPSPWHAAGPNAGCGAAGGGWDGMDRGPEEARQPLPTGCDPPAAARTPGPARWTDLRRLRNRTRVAQPARSARPSGHFAAAASGRRTLPLVCGPAARPANP